MVNIAIQDFSLWRKDDNFTNRIKCLWNKKISVQYETFDGSTKLLKKKSKFCKKLIFMKIRKLFKKNYKWNFSSVKSWMIWPGLNT